MCGRYSLTSPQKELEERFNFEAAADLAIQPRYNIAPTQEALAVVTDANSERRPQALRWGLIPSWAKDAAIGARFINARAESAADSSAFRVPFQKRRCLVVANGFYEWLREGKARTPFFSIEIEGAIRLCGPLGFLEVAREEVGAFFHDLDH